MKEINHTTQTPETCDCCTGVEVLTPIAIFNRPGLNAIEYRAGRHGSFLETMKARLSSSEFPNLAALTSREGSDASIALLDAWAIVADVLTFYQERITSEGFLRTAIERRSILELARLVGYRLRPGLSASVYLAYTLEPTQETTLIDIGNKAQSLPGPNEKPQVFETAEKLIAHSGLNLMKPRLTQPQFFNLGQGAPDDVVLLKGVSTNLRVNDALLLDFSMVGTAQPISSFYRAVEITPEPERDRTSVKLLPKIILIGPPPIPDNVKLKIRTAEICKKYLDREAFGLSATSKIVTRVMDRLKVLEDLSKATTGDITALEAELKTLIPYLTGEYAFSYSRGYDNIASWLGAMTSELEEIHQEDGDHGDEEAATGVPTFVELLRPFKQPQSLQPSNEAQLTRCLWI